jgi:hypothetical protein
MWNIDGIIISTEQELRDFCFNITQGGKPFKQDFRIAAQAYKAPVSTLIEILDSTGHNVERIS